MPRIAAANPRLSNVVRMVAANPLTAQTIPAPPRMMARARQKA
jgi:hypothetical protein